MYGTAQRLSFHINYILTCSQSEPYMSDQAERNIHAIHMLQEPHNEEPREDNK